MYTYVRMCTVFCVERGREGGRRGRRRGRGRERERERGGGERFLPDTSMVDTDHSSEDSTSCKVDGVTIAIHIPCPGTGIVANVWSDAAQNVPSTEHVVTKHAH